MTGSMNEISGQPSSFKKIHLTNRSSSWYFRYFVPTKYRPIFDLPEVYRSLHTKSQESANLKAQLLDRLISLFSKKTEGALKTPDVVDWPSLKNDLLEKIDHVCRYNVDSLMATDSGYFDEMLHNQFSKTQDSTQTHLIPHNHSHQYPFTDQTLFFKPDNPEATRTANSFVIDTSCGSSTLLSEALEIYIGEKKMLGLSERTAKTEITKIYALKNLLPDIPVGLLSIKHLRMFKEACLKLPRNWHKKEIYRKAGIKEILAMDIPEEEHRTLETVDHDLCVFRQFLKWGTRNGDLNIPEMHEVLKIHGKKSVCRRYNILDDEDIEKILQFPQYAQDADVPPSHFWVILIALFTGAKLEEICQLRVKDFFEDHGILCIDIGCEGRKPWIWSKRVVPIHPFLLNDLNIMAFVSGFKDREARLFPELKQDSNGWYGNTISKMFGRQKREFGIVSNGPGKKDFRSIRHTIIKKLKHLMVNELQVRQLLGYSDLWRDKHMGEPWGQYPTRCIYEVVKKISYDVDFSVLNTSHFIIH